MAPRSSASSAVAAAVLVVAAALTARTVRTKGSEYVAIVLPSSSPALRGRGAAGACWIGSRTRPACFGWRTGADGRLRRRRWKTHISLLLCVSFISLLCNPISTTSPHLCYNVPRSGLIDRIARRPQWLCRSDIDEGDEPLDIDAELNIPDADPEWDDPDVMEQNVDEIADETGEDDVGTGEMYLF